MVRVQLFPSMRYMTTTVKKIQPTVCEDPLLPHPHSHSATPHPRPREVNRNTNSKLTSASKRAPTSRGLALWKWSYITNWGGNAFVVQGWAPCGASRLSANGTWEWAQTTGWAFAVSPRYRCRTCLLNHSWNHSFFYRCGTKLASQKTLQSTLGRMMVMSNRSHLWLSNELFCVGY